MAIDYRQPIAEHVQELGRICYEAFKDIAERHGFEADFSSVDIGRMLMGMLVASEHNFGVAAMRSDQPVGSNFLMTADEVASVGPITVDPPEQGNGVGRELMQRVLDHADESGFESVRLQQDSYNMASLSLYASLGFDTKTPCALMEISPAAEPDDTVRPLTVDDLDDVEAMSRDIYKVSRRNEVANLLASGGIFPAVARERKGRMRGYLIIGPPGHSVAETEEDVVVMAQQAGRLAQMPDVLRVFCPLIEGGLYRRFLAAGFRSRKVMNLMVRGTYEAPDGVWTPSVGY